MWKVHDRNGKVALTLGWYTDRQEPYRVRNWYVGKAKADNWPGIIGQTVTFRGNTGTVYDQIRGRTMRIDTDTDEWSREQERERVRKPRRGRDYDFEWKDGDWRRFWL